MSVSARFDRKTNIPCGTPTQWGDALTGDQTIEFWIRPRDLTRRQNPICKCYGAEFAITVEPHGQITYYFGSAGTNDRPYRPCRPPEPVLAVGEWTHLAIVRDLGAGTLTWYRNGEPVHQGLVDGMVPTTSDKPLRIGHGYAGFFDGDLGEIRVWSTARSAQEIATWWSRRAAGSEDGLIAHWPLTDGFGQRIAETTSTRADGIPATGAVRWLREGPPLPDLRRHRVFDGSGRIDLPDDPALLLGEHFTLECWVRPDTPVHPTSALIGDDEPSAVSGPGLWLVDGAALQFGTGTGADVATGMAGPVLAPGSWSHLAATCDAGTWRIYVDGALVHEQTLAAGAPVAPLANIGSSFAGALSRVRAWSVVRTPEQVEAGRTGEVEPLDPTLVGDWSLDDHGAIARDASFRRLDGRYADTRSVRDALPIEGSGPGTALSVSAHGDQVSIPNTWAHQLTGDLTVELWVRPTVVSSRRNPIGKAYGGEGMITLEPTGQATFYFGTAGGNDKPYQAFRTSDPVLQAGKWTHLAYVRDLGAMEVRAYVDGVEIETWPIPEAFANPAPSARNWRIGSEYAGTFLGEITEVRLWKVARTAAEIAALFTERATGDELGLAALWPLAAAAGTVAEGRAGAAAGALQGASHWRSVELPVVGRGELGTSIRFDGETGQVLAKDVRVFAMQVDATLEVWFRPHRLDRVQCVVDFGHSRLGVLQVLPDGRLTYKYGRTLPSGPWDCTSVLDFRVRSGVWSHVAVVRDHANQQIRWFVNGVLIQQDDTQLEIADSPRDLLLGAGWGGRFEGEIKEFRGWRTARTAQEVRDNLHRRVSIVDEGLAIYLPLSEGAGGSAVNPMDPPYSNGLLETGATWVRGGPALGSMPDRGRVLSTTSNSGVDFSHTKLKIAGDQTIELWLQPRKIGPATVYGQNPARQGAISLTADGRPVYEFGAPDGTQRFEMSRAIPVGEWSHLALVRELSRGRLRWYLDGALVDETSTAFSAALTSTDVRLGMGHAGAFDGHLTEVRLWGRARADAEIRADLRQRLSGYELGLTAVWRLDDTPGHPLTMDSRDVSKPVAHGYPFGPSSRVIADMPFDPDALAEISPALELRGGHVDLPDSPHLALPGSFTIELWLAPNAPDDAEYRIIGDGAAESVISAPWISIVDRTALRFGFGDGTAVKADRTGLVLSPGVWNHVVASYDGTTLRVQIGRQTVHEVELGGVPAPTPIAKIGCGTPIGTVGEVRLWSTARSAEQLDQAMFRRLWFGEPELVANWPLSGDAKDTAGDGLHGTMVGDARFVGLPFLPLAGSTLPATLPNSPMAPPSGNSSLGSPAGALVPVPADDPASSPIDLQRLTALGDLSVSLFFVPTSLPIAFEGTMEVQAYDRATCISGTATVGGPFDLEVPLTVALFDDDGAGWMVKFAMPTPPSDLLDGALESAIGGPVWAAMDVLVMPYLALFDQATVVFANTDGEDGEVGGYVAGCNLYTTVTADRVPPFDLVHRAFPGIGLDTREVVLGIGTRDSGLGEFYVGAALQLDLEMVPSFLVLNSLAVNVERGALSTTLGAEAMLTLSLAGEELRFRGGVSGSGGTDAQVALWGALDTADGAWEDPFGIPGLTIRGLGVEVGTSTNSPVVLGLRGDASLGGGVLDGSIGLRIDTENFVFDIQSERGVSVPDVIGALTGSLIDPSGFLDLSLEDLQLTIAPNGGSIAGVAYPAGLTVKGTLDAWGLQGNVDGHFHREEGGHLRGHLDPIVLRAGGIDFLRITDTAGTGGASVDFVFTQAQIGGTIDGKLEIAGIYEQSTQLVATSSGFVATLGSSTGPLYSGTEIALTDRGFALDWQTGIRASVDVGPYDISVHVGCEIEVEIDAQRFSQQVTFHFGVYGETFDVGPVALSVPITGAQDLVDAFLEYAKHLFEDMLVQWLTDIGVAAYYWLRTVGELTAEQVVRVYQELEVAAEEVAQSMASAGYAVADVATALVSVLGVEAEEAVALLGLGATEAARVLRDTFGRTAEQIASYLEGTAGVTVDVATDVLEEIGYGAEEIRGAIEAVFPGDWGDFFGLRFPDIDWGDIWPF